MIRKVTYISDFSIADGGGYFSPDIFSFFRVRGRGYHSRNFEM